MASAEKLRQFVASIEAGDKDLAQELQQLRKSKKIQEKASDLTAKINEGRVALEGLPDSGYALETIVLRTGRPVLEIFENNTVLEIEEAESKMWKAKLAAAKANLKLPIHAVGRIDLRNHQSFEWVGTGWLVSRNVIVTNRHVAEVFAQGSGDQFVFRQGTGGRRVEASIDFLQEAKNQNKLIFKIKKVLHIDSRTGYDVALLEVEPQGGGLFPQPVSLLTSGVRQNQEIAVIGYPARDSRIPDQQLMIDIFGDVYDKKRLAPGKITGVTSKEIRHDCSTLGGNSGSLLADLATGKVVGLHFAGRFLEANFAVPAAIVENRLANLSRPGRQRAERFVGHTEKEPQKVSLARSSDGQHELEIAVPVNIKVSIGKLSGGDGNGSYKMRPSGEQEEDELFITEGRPEDYNDRDGYDPDFLGVNVPLPELDESLDKLFFDNNGDEEFELKYRHFSVVMSESRRQCFFSACNIDGPSSVGMKRGPWRLDPRIDQSAQIKNECYGNPPKFSRGHMTRREDPIWGDDDSAAQGNADSMHVTNAVPQMQAMNAGIWLKLENYALQNARKDDMRISVFTGPVFADDDPERFDVLIPVLFWKVIVFIHDRTKKLCATGYTMSQEDFLDGQEFVFGEHNSSQVRISDIEKLTKISFGNLKNVDPLANEEGLAGVTLNQLKDIRFF